jgi:hypothetical protein
VLDGVFAVAESNQETWNHANLGLLWGDTALARTDGRDVAEARYAGAMAIAAARDAASLVQRRALRRAAGAARGGGGQGRIAGSPSAME